MVSMEKAVELFKQGKSYSAIARELDLGRTTVTKYLQRQGYFAEVSEKVLSSNHRTAEKLKKDDIYKCLHCGKKFGFRRGENKHMYCSRECAWEARRKPETPKPPIVCVICGQEFDGRGGTKYCTDDCRKEKERRRSREYEESKHIPNSFACKECGRQYTTNYGEKNSVYCSSKCLKKATGRIEKAKRRARMYTVECESVDPIYVLKRDGWRCMKCGVRTPQRYRGTTHERAPEVDHVVPLSRGGTHVRGNLQCLCRKCNIEKGATTYGQARLWV